MRKKPYCRFVVMFSLAWSLLEPVHAQALAPETAPLQTAPVALQPAPQTPPPDSFAEEGSAPPTGARKWTVTVAPYVYHWKPDPDHRYAFAFALEHRITTQRLYGLSMFRNSFGQPSAYVYAGRSWDDFWDNPRLSARLTVGVIYGYVGEYHGKVPFNWNGFSPTVIPALAYRFSPQDSLDLSILGTAGLVFGFSRHF